MGSAFRMIDVGNKPVTHRIAVARGEIQLSQEVRRAIEDKKVPKGDVLTLAEIAGITAAKRTYEILPLCHPLALDAVDVQCVVDSAQNCVVIVCTVSTHGRTGVEMEALTGVSAALLCVYDLTKGLDKGATITGIRLEYKEGGKSGQWLHPEGKRQEEDRPKELSGLRSAVLTVSDRCACGESADESGEILATFLRERGAELCRAQIVPDEINQIHAAIEELAVNQKLALVIITGGTGLGPRDVTPEAVRPLWSKTLPGFGETFRSRGLLNTSRAWLSRAEAGVVERTLVILLPGSPAGVRDGLTVLDRMIPHMISMIHGEGH